MILLVLISVLIFGFNINSFPLRNWDEGWYAEIIKNMAIKGTGLLMPFWNGDYYFDKPPLYFWLTTPIVRIFGAGEWQMRIVSVGAAVMATMTLYFIAKKLFGSQAGFWAAVVFMSFGQVGERFSGGNLDALMICMLLLALLSYLHNKFLLSGLFVGLTILSKGVAFGFYPLIIIGIFDFLKYKTIRLTLIKIPIVALFVSGWWFVLGSLNFGQRFINVYISDPANGNLDWRGAIFSFSFVMTLLRDTAIFVLPSLLFLVLHHKKGTKKERDSVIAFLFAGLIIFLPLNFFADRIGWYLLPIYPGLAIISGFAFANIRKVHTRWAIVFVSAFVLQGIILIYIQRRTPDRSYVSAAVSREFKSFEPKGLVVLEDNDFANFLYYSGDGELRSLQKEAKPSEWWIINYEQFQRIIESGQQVTLVTQKPLSWEKYAFSKVGDLSHSFSIMRK